jgi:hypothetical protein
VLPNFLIIGAAKAGTTSLYHYVGAHPQAFMSAKKELSFFCEEFKWGLGLEWYESQFEGAGDAVAVGEASPRYSVYPLYKGVPGRIATVLPGVRLIYLVREPIDRMLSAYLDNTIHGLEDRPVEEALTSDPFYVWSSSYGLQLEQYLACCRREQILVVRSEDLRRDRQAALGRVFQFLGIDPGWRGKVTEMEFLTTSQRRAPLPRFRRIWFSPVSARIARVLPRSLKDGFRTATSRRVEVQRAEISAPFRRHMEGLLREDQRRFRAIVGESFEGWGLG